MDHFNTNSTATLAAASRLDALLAAIQPSPSSEFRRLTIAYYICGVIKRCFHPHHQVEAFMFGSVPLRAVLPDGDIDISVFATAVTPTGGGERGPLAGPLRDAWASQLLRALEHEAGRPDAPFKIRDVQIIHAEVKLVKCVVSDVVVDVSFDTVGGLCTVAFLEAADRHIGRQHLFKRSILLLKAWCYYESRLLGAHHGLISSYALEVLVLYIFNLHHAELHTPLDVLRRFLAVLGSFDWEHYCLSLQGPLPLPELHKPHVDSSKLVPGSTPPLLDSDFMRRVLQQYSVHQQPATAVAVGAPPLVAPHFLLKHLNIVDPLLPSNNLGRSVSKASYARVKKALVLGSRTLEEALVKDPRSAVEALDQFFRNTWRSPVRMAADNQTFLARLSSIQLPPAATEAVVAAAAAAGFPLHLPASSSTRPVTPPAPPPAGLPVAAHAAARFSNHSGESQHCQQQQQQQSVAQAAMLQLLLSDPLNMPAWQQQGAPYNPMLLRQQQQQAAVQQRQQQQQQAAVQQRQQQQQQAAVQQRQQQQQQAAVQQRQQQAAQQQQQQAAQQQQQQAAQQQQQQEQQQAALQQALQQPHLSDAQQAVAAAAPLAGLGGSREHAISGGQAGGAGGGALLPAGAPSECARAADTAAAGTPHPSPSEGLVGQGTELSTAGLANGSGSPPTPAADQAVQQQVACGTNLNNRAEARAPLVHPLAAAAAAGVAATAPSTPPVVADLAPPAPAPGAAPAASSMAAGGGASAAGTAAPLPRVPMAAAARHDSPHSFFGGDLEAMERNLVTARRQRQPRLVPTRAAGQQGAAVAAAPHGAAPQPQPAQALLPLPVSLGALSPRQPGSAGQSPTAGSVLVQRQRQRACASPTKAAGQVAVPSAGRQQAAADPMTATPTPGVPAVAPGAAALAAQTPGGGGASHDLAAAMAVLPAVRTRSSLSEAGVLAPRQVLAQPQPPTPRSPLQQPAPLPLPIVPRGPASDGCCSPKTFAAALRASSRSSSIASLASPVAAGFAAAPTSLSSSPSRSHPTSGSGTPLTTAAVGGGSGLASRRPAWVSGSSSNLAAMGAVAAPAAVAIAAVPASQAPPQPRSWSAVAAAGTASSQRSPSSSLTGNTGA